MKQLKASVPDELAERLERATAKSGRSLSAEICARLETSLAQEAAGSPTYDFLMGVPEMAIAIELELGNPWFKTPAAHYAFGEVILTRLERFRPKGPIEMPAQSDRPNATVTPAGKKDAKGLLEMLARSVEFQLHRFGPGFSKSELRQGLVEVHRRAVASGEPTFVEDEGAKGRPFDPLDDQAKFDQQRKKGKSHEGAHSSTRRKQLGNRSRHS
jgi:hypothetical protein